jgi:AcrR family transcriptional regulator
MSTPKRRQRRLPREQRREAIVEGATRAFAQAGFAATSMAGIAAAAGVTPLIVYRHFDSKNALYRAALARAAAHVTEELARTPDAGGVEGIRVRPLLAAARRDPAAFQLLWRHSAREPLFESHARKLHARIVATIARALAKRVPADTLEWAAHSTSTYLVQSVLVWLDYGRPERDELFATAIDESMHGGMRAWIRLTSAVASRGARRAGSGRTRSAARPGLRRRR